MKDLVVTNPVLQISIDNHIESTVFLLNYFLYVYGLELFMQLVVLVYSFFCYNPNGEPPWIIMIDFFITLLMLIELRCHYLGSPHRFWTSDQMKFDSFVCFFSVLFIVLYFIAKQGLVELSQQVETVIHICRESTRILKLPTFIRNFNRMLKTIETKTTVSL